MPAAENPTTRGKSRAWSGHPRAVTAPLSTSSRTARVNTAGTLGWNRNRHGEAAGAGSSAAMPVRVHLWP